MAHYFQCSKCKILKSVDDIKFETKTINQDDGGTIDITDIKIENLSEIVCHDRRMRELSKDQYDHEILQRDYIDNGGSIPKDTELMKKNYSP